MADVALRLIDAPLNGAAGLAADADLVRVVHALPGRIRYHLPAWDGSRARELEAAVRRAPGVVEVEANPVTRNVLVYFDLAEAGSDDVKQAVARVATGAPPILRVGSRTRKRRPGTKRERSASVSRGRRSHSAQRLEIVVGSRAAVLLPCVPKLLSLTLSMFTKQGPAGLALLGLDCLDLLTRLQSEAV